MNITNVVNDHTECEGSCISLDWEVFDDLGIVVAGLVVRASVGKPVGEVFKSSNNIVGVVLESVVRKRTALVKVGLIDEVPSSLEAIGALDVIGESSSLCEGVVDFASDQAGMRFFEGVQLSKCS